MVLPNNHKRYTINQLRQKTIIVLATPSVMHLLIFVGGMMAFVFLQEELYLDISLINLLCVLSTFTSNKNIYGDLIAIYHIWKKDDIAQKMLDNIYDM